MPQSRTLQSTTPIKQTFKTPGAHTRQLGDLKFLLNTIDKQEKPVLGSEAVKVLLPFATTCLCKLGFSVLWLSSKQKNINWLQPEHYLRVE